MLNPEHRVRPGFDCRWACATPTNFCLLALLVCVALCLPAAAAAESGTLQAGCHAIDISPRVLPAIRNGGFLEATSDRVDDPLHARCLVLSDGKQKLAIVIVDSCMLPRDVCDAIKGRATEKCGIATDRILIAATHTHSAPSAMDYCLGARQDAAYVDYLIPRVAEGIVAAHTHLQPAQAGWAVVDAPAHTHSRRWLHRPEMYPADPFGEHTVRAMMHPGYRNPSYLGPSGPVDTKLTLLSIQAADGRPLCLLANYSMHYFGHSGGFSADYYGDFARYLEQKLGQDDSKAPRMMAIMSQGTSGDLHWMDYAQPERRGYPREQYARELGDLALKALQGVNYSSSVELAMAETRLTVGRRLPSEARLQWARSLDAQRGERRPRDLAEVYAEQALWLHAHPTVELVLQAARIGEVGLTAIPNEVFAITGLKLKEQSPLQPLMNLELANGAEGYIPPPEQHYLGGYTTWPARTAGLETEAEPKIVAALLDLLDKVAGGAKRRPRTADFYSDEQKRVIEQARRDNNNRENRGDAPALPATK